MNKKERAKQILEMSDEELIKDFEKNFTKGYKEVTEFLEPEYIVAMAKKIAQDVVDDKATEITYKNEKENIKTLIEFFGETK